MLQELTPDVSRLYEIAGRFFKSPESAVQEMLQNAYRSYLPHVPGRVNEIIVTWVQNKKVLVVTDYGRGIRDPLLMLSPMASEWADNVRQDQDPAGLGVFGILAFSDAVTWNSTFGSIRIESQRFFKDATYRSQLRQMVDTSAPLATGTVVMCENFRAEYMLVMNYVRAIGGLFPQTKVMLCGQAVPPDQALRWPVIGKIGNSLVRSSWTDMQSHCSYNQPIMFWHGHKIPVTGRREPPVVGVYHSKYGPLEIGQPKGLVVEILDENVITPQLPDRQSLVMDDVTTEFLRKLDAIWVDYVGEAMENRLDHLVGTAGIFAREGTCPGVPSEFMKRYFDATMLSSCRNYLRLAHELNPWEVCRKLLEEPETADCKSRLVLKKHVRNVSHTVLVRFPNEVKEFDTSHAPGGLVFERGGECQDPLADEDFYFQDNRFEDESQYTLVLDAELVQDHEWATIIRLKPNLSLYLGKPEAVDLTDTPHETIEYDGDVHLTPLNPLEKDVSGDFLSSCPKSAANIYVNIRSTAIREDGRSDDEEEEIDTCQHSWDQTLAALAGKLFIEHLRLDELVARFGGKFSVDNSTRTITDAAGREHRF